MREFLPYYVLWVEEPTTSLCTVLLESPPTGEGKKERACGWECNGYWSPTAGWWVVKTHAIGRHPWNAQWHSKTKQGEESSSSNSSRNRLLSGSFSSVQPGQLFPFPTQSTARWYTHRLTSQREWAAIKWVYLASSHFHQGRSGQTLKLLAKIRNVACNHRPSSCIQEKLMSEGSLGSTIVS